MATANKISSEQVTLAGNRRIPVVGTRNLISAAPEIGRLGINGLILSAVAQCGDVFSAKLGPYPVVFVAHPDLLRHILVSNKENYSKRNPMFDALRPLAGNGIFLSEGDFWRSQRRIIQPEFTRKGVAELVDDMTTVAASIAAEWDLQRRRGEIVNASESMRQAAMRIICQAVLDIDVGKDARNLGRALDNLMTIFQLRFSLPGPFGNAVEWAGARLQDRFIQTLDEFIECVIEQNRQYGTDGVVSRLLASPDPETGRKMSVNHLRDEIITLFIAGHETTATTLAWAFFMLAEHPNVGKRLRIELDKVLGGRLPGADDLGNLPYTRAIFDEALRLFPPLPFVARQAVEEDRLGNYVVPAGTTVMPSFFAVQRHPGFWDQPDQFVPERFLPENAGTIEKYAYLPFGAGPRTCLGNHFAIAEGQVMLATLAQRFDFKLVSSANTGPNRFAGSLKPARPVRLKLRSRLN